MRSKFILGLVEVNKNFIGYSLRPEVEIVWEAGKELPGRFGDQQYILRGSSMVFVLSRNFAVTYALFGYF